MAEGHNPLEHAMDHPTIELPWGRVFHLPKIHTGIPIDGFRDFQLTRFMVMEVLAAALIILIMVPLARHVAKHPVSKGPFMNAFEALVLFIRDKVARPSIGGHDADQFAPYLLTVFFFILFNNLFGLLPAGASATGNINVTAVLAIATLGAVIYAGMKTSGPVGFWIKLVPHMDVPIVLKVFLWPLMFVIEVLGLLIRHFVLSVRLFANMLAGHVVLGVILGFILLAGGSIWYIVAPASILGVVMISFLELLVAFLQAYIFTLLSALFIGSAAHPH
jgi:F-type H+-transporting ATPase subunit a